MRAGKPCRLGTVTSRRRGVRGRGMLHGAGLPLGRETVGFEVVSCQAGAVIVPLDVLKAALVPLFQLRGNGGGEGGQMFGGTGWSCTSWWVHTCTALGKPACAASPNNQSNSATSQHVLCWQVKE